MEAALVQERAIEQHVHQLLRGKDTPAESLLPAFDTYRHLCQANLLADLQGNAPRETALWEAHVAGKQYFHRALKDSRSQGESHVVSTRKIIKLYLEFLKNSERFYRGYIHQLHAHFGGIPELVTVAHQVQKRNEGGANESESSLQLSSDLRARVLNSCHQTLIYLGDLARYRASEKLDKNPNFGPALGYYGLACTLRPTSGLGHHQQAIVALSQPQKNDLRAIYHFYRAIVVDEPHPHAANNLRLEFDKTNRAWMKGEPLVQGSTNNKDAPKHMLAGWFVRLHSKCFKGETFDAYNELEQTLLRQLSAVLKNAALDVDKALLRMVMVNTAAQYNAGEHFRSKCMHKTRSGTVLIIFADDKTLQSQQAFFSFFRFNITFYTTILQTFHNELRGLDANMGDDGEAEIATKLTPVMRRCLPSLRLYSAWLLGNIFLLDGLKADQELKQAIDGLWQTYARVVNALADEQVFGIWALEEYAANYMLEEDADTLGFKPLLNEDTKIIRNWSSNGILKPRFSDAGVNCLSPDEEMLARLKDLLEDGIYLCHDDQQAPLTLLGTRIYFGQPPEEAIKAAEEAKKQPPKPMPKPKPLSYAKAAARSHPKPSATAPQRTNTTSSTTSSRVQQNQMRRMVNDLVDEDDDNNPVTPPQQHAVHPTIITNGEADHLNGIGGVPSIVNDVSAVPSYQPKIPTAPVAIPGRQMPIGTPPTVRKDLPASIERLRSESVSGLWHDAPAATSPSCPPGLPMGTLTTPIQAGLGHQRDNSASSIRSASSALNGAVGDSWSSLDSAPRRDVHAPHVPALAREGPMDGYAKFSESGVASTLLFGASGSMWSASSDAAHERTADVRQGSRA
jgi:hypothetical protein